MSGQGLTEQFGTFDAETFGPTVGLGDVVVVSAEAHHDCHTIKYMPSYTRSVGLAMTPGAVEAA